MDGPSPPYLRLVPGERLVLFSLHLASGHTLLACPPGRFLEGLSAACALMGFGDLQRDEERIDDILPWAGNV